jgi:ABC-2 type transport system permease protein
MKNKLTYLTKYSLYKKIKSKWFIFANIALLILIMGLVNGDRIIAFFGGDFSNDVEISVIDNTNISYEIFETEMEKNKRQVGTLINYSIILDDSLEEDKVSELEGTRNILIVLNNDDNNYIFAKIIAERFNDQILQQIISSSLNNTKAAVALSLSGISLEELERVYFPIDIEKVVLSEEEETDFDSILAIVFPVLILPFYFLIIFVVQMIGLEITEEKSTKGMEIIISNVPPRVHFLSKIIAANAFVFMQSMLLIIFGMSGLLVRRLLGSTEGIADGLGIEMSKFWEAMITSGIVDKLIYVIPLTLILFILTFLAYSLIAGISASITVNIEDYQQILGPIMIVLVIGFYLALMSAMFEGSIFIIIMSYIPFISALLAPVLLLMGQIGIIDILISLLLLLLTVTLLMNQGLKVYRVGILNYSSDKIWLRAMKIIKNRDKI